MKQIIAVIPARYQSTRFPGKPLAMIAGQTMIRRVYGIVSSVSRIDSVIVATDDERILKEVQSFGGNAVITGPCECGTDRVYEAVKNMDCGIVINVQGDEPLLKPEMIEELLDSFQDGNVKMSTLRKKIVNKIDINNPNIVKVVVDEKEDAVYFSRLPIPYNRDGLEEMQYYKHIGIYGYTKEFLEMYVNLPRKILEKSESLEQLRTLEYGYKIRVKETQFDSIGVDLPEHIQKIEKELGIER